MHLIWQVGSLPDVVNAFRIIVPCGENMRGAPSAVFHPLPLLLLPACSEHQGDKVTVAPRNGASAEGARASRSDRLLS